MRRGSREHEVTLWLRRHTAAANPKPPTSGHRTHRPPAWRARTMSAVSRRRRKRTLDLRWLRRGVLWLLGIAFTVECGAAVLTSPALYVRKVKVTGMAGLTAQEAQTTLSQAQAPPQSNVVRFPTERLARSLQSLPWVAKASVQWRLPDTLEIQLTSRIPAAILVTSEGTWEVDAAGVPIRAARSVSKRPKIVLQVPAKPVPGTPVDVPGVAEAVTIATNNMGPKPLPITEIQVDQNADLCLNMRDGVQIKLGPVDDLEDKLALVRRIYEGAPGIGEQVQMIDVRCPDAPACTLYTAVAAAPRSARQDAARDTEVDSLGASGGSTRLSGELLRRR